MLTFEDEDDMLSPELLDVGEMFNYDHLVLKTEDDLSKPSITGEI